MILHSAVFVYQCTNVMKGVCPPCVRLTTYQHCLFVLLFVLLFACLFVLCVLFNGCLGCLFGLVWFVWLVGWLVGSLVGWFGFGRLWTFGHTRKIDYSVLSSS